MLKKAEEIFSSVKLSLQQVTVEVHFVVLLLVEGLGFSFEILLKSTS